MNVLILTTEAYGGYGGIALYNRDLAEALVTNQKIKNVVIIPRNIPGPMSLIPKNVYFLTHAAGSKFKFIISAFRHISRRFDLIICGHINLLPIVVFFNLFKRRPLALVVYGIDVWKQPNHLARYCLKGVNAIWSISEITRDNMNKWARLPKHIYTILPNAIHLEQYQKKIDTQYLINRYDLKECEIIMTLGRLSSSERYKGIDEVLEVMPALLKIKPKLKYILAGDGSDLTRLKDKAISLGVVNSVIFTGMIDEKEKTAHFMLADAYVMPGYGEGFGFVYLEALACGVPCVGSKIDGSREALRGGSLGELVDPRDPGAIMQGILTALSKRKETPSGLDYFSWPSFLTRINGAILAMKNSIDKI